MFETGQMFRATFNPNIVGPTILEVVASVSR